MNIPTPLFLGLSAPACTLVAQKLQLLDCASPEQPLLVVVPTRDSVRLLREQLAVLSAGDEADGAFLCPRIISASQLTAAMDATCASPTLQQAALFSVLQREGRSFRRLAPRTTGWNSSDWLAKAGQMQQLYATLIREGIRPDTSSAPTRALAEEEPLWQEIFTLYSLYLHELHNHGLHAPEEKAGQLLRPGMRVILACVPSLSRQAQQLLEASGLPVEVWLHAEPRHGIPDWFDAWGRPSAKWLDTPADNTLMLGFRDWEKRFLVCGDVERMAEETAHAAGRCRGEAVCVAVCDSTMESAVAEAFAHYGVPTVRPRGIPFSASGWHRLLLALAHMVEMLEQSNTSATDMNHLPAEATAALLHHTILTEGLGIRDSEQVAREAENMMQKGMPVTFGLLRKLAGGRTPALAAALDILGPWLACLDSTPSLLEALQAIAAHQVVEGTPDALKDATELSARFTEQMDAHCGSLLTSGWLEELSCHNTLQLLLASGSSAAAPHPEGALSLRGWLELSFAPEKHLILAGLHDDIIPERWPSNPYLTPSVRRSLHIESDDDKAARDACLLHSLYCCRPGRVQAIFTLLNTRRDPLFPSSSFFRLAPPQELARLVEHFFGAKRRCLSTTGIPFNRSGWHYLSLNLPAGAQEPLMLAEMSLADLGESNPLAGKSISPSRLKSFFACPLRFWISNLNGIRDEQIDAMQRDLTARDIGDCLHAALQDFVELYPGKAAFLSAFPNEGEERLAALVTREMLAAYTRKSEEEYGKPELMPRSMQHEAISHRLAAYAKLHLELWNEGWEAACDQNNKPMLEYAIKWNLDGHPLEFRIDRIDRRLTPAGGYEYRVIDYKTGEAESCYKKHLTPLSGNLDELELTHPSASLPLVNGNYRWTDLQLPLYTAWALEHFAGSPVSSAYITLSRHAALTALHGWDNPDMPAFFNPDHDFRNGAPSAEDTNYLYGNAMQWIRFGLASIAGGRCLIPAEMMGWKAPEYDIFKDLLMGDSLERLFLSFAHN